MRIQRVAQVCGPAVKDERCEIWTYNLGPDSFQQLATFEGGKLVKVERGSYGFSP